MKARLFCRRCRRPATFDPAAADAAVECAACGELHRIVAGPEGRAGDRLDPCPVCGKSYFYREKDFNGWIGMGIMAAAVAGFLVFAKDRLLLAFSFLAAAALLDLLAYLAVPFRYVCYDCLTSFHGVPGNPEIGPYDLGTAGRFADDFEAERERRKG